VIRHDKFRVLESYGYNVAETETRLCHIFFCKTEHSGAKLILRNYFAVQHLMGSLISARRNERQDGKKSQADSNVFTASQDR
ncbi:MAG: hypothetical protein IJ756_07690, partial [Paludibacteraceae bacterium]|nr:hypothetical protein [Paludibacteraceae bacterium]